MAISSLAGRLLLRKAPHRGLHSGQLSTMTLYHCVGARSLRCLWALSEVGAGGYDLVTMPFPPRVHHKAFLEENPLGTVPFLVDGDVRLTESVAATVYVVEASGGADHPLLVSRGDGARHYGDALNWLSHADATLTFPQTLVLRYRDFEPHKGLQQAAADYERWYHARLRLVDAALADGRAFLCAGRFTVADICVGYALFLGREIGIDGRYAPQTAAYLDRLLARPAFEAARREEAASLAAFAPAD